MGRIQSSVGLITGVPIASTVDQLIALSARPRDLLQTRNQALQSQQTAIGQLTALTIAIQVSINQLADSTVYQQRTADSSDTSKLSAAVTGNPTSGTYQFTPIRAAQNHQVVSSGVSSLDEELGTGEVKLGFGGFVDKGVSLDLLNKGNGVERGKIRITDRSGTSSVVDLRFAATVDDVIQAINNDEDINVWAQQQGDAIRLVDQTGQTVSNLTVREVGFGSTAVDLGLGGINVASAEATGSDILALYDDLQVSQLNDKNGLSIRDELPDLNVSFRDGTSLQIDLTRADVSTLSDLLDALNAADPTRLAAAISSDGDHLVLTDLTTDTGGSFGVSSALGGTLAEDLQITGAAVGGALTSGRLLGGLKDVLLSSLSGGQGLGDLGQLNLTDRSGATAAVDLSSADTLGAVVDAINNAGLAITAEVNTARTGVRLTDTSGATTSNLIVANGDATNTADRLGLAVDAAQMSVDSGSLGLQVVHEGLKLSELNHGQGVERSSFVITDSTGSQDAVNLRTIDAQTVGDVIEAVNGLSIGVTARINDTGNGILLLDTAGGTGTMTVAEGGSNSSAADLGLLGSAETRDIDGTPTQVIDGSTTATVQLETGDTLQDLVDKINALDSGVSAAVFNSGGGATPYRMTLTSKRSGLVGEMMIDASQTPLDFQQLVNAQDAAILVGSADSPGAGLLATSSDNRFDAIVDGVELNVLAASTDPVTITVAASDKQLVSAAKSLVSQFNKLRDKIDEVTAFNEVDNSTGVLFGSNEALRVDTTLARMMTNRYFGVGAIESLAEVGIRVDDQGKLALDESKLQAEFEEDPQAVEQFFTDSDLGFATKMNAALDSLAGEGNSLLINRNNTLQTTIEQNSAKIDDWNARLDHERQQLLDHFNAMELAIARIQSNLSAIQSLAALVPSTSNGA